MSNITVSATSVTLAPASYYNDVYVESGVRATGTATAIYGGSHAWFIHNSGLVQGGTGWGIELVHGGWVENRRSGLITGASSGGAAGGVMIAGQFGSVYNHGSIGSATGVGVSLAADGLVENFRGARITGAAAAIELSGAGGGTVSNQGYIGATTQWGVLVDGRAYIFNKAGATITSTYAGIGVLHANGTVTNSGLIEAMGSASTYGILLGDGGSISNAASGSIHGGVDGIRGTTQAVSLLNSGSIAGLRAGVVLAAGGYVTNERPGLISGGIGLEIYGRPALVSNAGSIRGSTGAGISLGSGGSVANRAGGAVQGAAGGILGGGYGSIANGGYIGGGSGYGVSLAFGANVSNGVGATIEGAGGVYVARTGATVTNDGTISASSGEGVRLTGGGTVVNAGTIGGTAGAVYLGGFGPDTLVIDPGAVFDGQVVAATTGNSYLQLGAGSAARIAGLGAQYQGFTSVQADRGSDWSLQGSNTVGGLIALGTIEIAGGTLSAAGSLTGSGVLLADPGSAIGIGQDSTWSGTIDLSHASITFGGSLAGGGSIDIGAQSRLGIHGAAGGQLGVAFTGAAGVLDLGDPAGFRASLGGFAAGDTIDLLAMAADAAVFSSGTLTVTEGKSTVALLHFAGSYARDAFRLGSDGHAGTAITLHS